MTRVLILEDVFDLAAAWRSALRAAGYDVTLAYTSSEAIAQNQHQGFDIFVVDMRIEIAVENLKDSGVKFLAHLADVMSPEQLRSRVIGVSGLLIDKDDAAVRGSFHLFDVEQFMPKPFEPRELVEQVELALKAIEDSR